MPKYFFLLQLAQHPLLSGLADSNCLEFKFLKVDCLWNSQSCSCCPGQSPWPLVSTQWIVALSKTCLGDGFHSSSECFLREKYPSISLALEQGLRDSGADNTQENLVGGKDTKAHVIWQKKETLGGRVWEEMGDTAEGRGGEVKVTQNKYVWKCHTLTKTIKP